MGRFVNVGKGSKRRPENRQAVLEGLERLYGNKGVQSGRFRQDPETKKFISAYDWYMKYGKPKVKTHFIQGDIEPYQSPIDDRVITSRSKWRDDLKRHGCRPYEGLEAEQKEANRYRAEQEKKFEASLGDALEQTAADLRWKRVKPETHIQSQWLLGED